jgi:K+-transporting ATPase ATPase B chain
VPLALKGVKYRPIGAGPLLAATSPSTAWRLVAPFVGIKAST